MLFFLATVVFLYIFQVVCEEEELEELHVVLRQAIGGDLDDSLSDSFLINHSGIEYNSEAQCDENDVSDMELSMSHLTVNESHEPTNNLSLFKIEKFQVPPLLTRHPPPAIGRDDDINKLQSILDDVLVKSGICQDPIRCEQNHVTTEKILCGVDQKIGNNLLKLISNGGRNNHFIPEFPLLHLRKSKITILLSSYQNAGLLDLIQFMKDESQQDWSKLISIQHIDMATHIVKRISTALHVAFVIKFCQCLQPTECKQFTQDLVHMTANQLAEKWSNKLDCFITESMEVNATFALHYNIMQHCDEVVALSLSERMGGDDGYALLLSTVKSSLAFSFVNGATSYAPYCVKLLAAHESCGYYYQSLKRTLYSTPVDNSVCNFASDTKREIDHQQVTKCFRSGSNINAIRSRMSLIDPFNEVHRKFVKPAEKKADDLGWRTTSTDLKHIVPTAQLIIRKGLDIAPCTIPYNVYGKKVTALPLEILDMHSLTVGEYLMKKFIYENNIFKANSAQAPPDVNDVIAPKPLLTRLKVSKGVTLKRCTTRSKAPQSATTTEEAKRKQTVMKETKQVDRFSSKMNACQAVVNPDGSKPAVNKAMGVSKALIHLLSTSGKADAKNENEFIQLGVPNLPQSIADIVKFVTVEFAGIKFKAYVQSGSDYVEFVNRKVFNWMIKAFPKVQHIIICEEKYMFTPDIFKAQTRVKRNQKLSGISHLKSGENLINEGKYDREAILSTSAGKSAVSIYLAKHIADINLNRSVTVDIDSELYTEGCSCKEQCKLGECLKYTIPIRCIFDKKSKPNISKLNHIHQVKGEAEMAQVDWLFEMIPFLNEGDAIASLVTSGDIDAVPIHMYAISRKWPRNDDNHFKFNVYVILEKPKEKLDIYNITAIVNSLEKCYDDNQFGMKIALILSMGGNDFLPKFYSVAHRKMLMAFVENSKLRENLFSVNDGAIELDVDTYVQLIKFLYSPRKVLSSNTESDYETVRLLTIKSTISKDSELTSVVRNARSWLPPESAVKRIAELIKLFIQYIEGVGNHSAKLPDLALYLAPVFIKMLMADLSTILVQMLSKTSIIC